MSGDAVIPDGRASDGSTPVMREMNHIEMAPDRQRSRQRYMLDGGIFVGGWPLAAFSLLLIVGIIGIGFIIGAEFETVPAAAALVLACGSGFAATMTDKLFDIRRRDYIKVSQGQASQQDIDRLDRIHPKPETLRARKRYALAGAWIGIGSVAAAGWWAHQSFVDAVVTGLIAVVATLLSAVLGSLAMRGTS